VQDIDAEDGDGQIGRFGFAALAYPGDTPVSNQRLQLGNALAMQGGGEEAGIFEQQQARRFGLSPIPALL